MDKTKIDKMSGKLGCSCFLCNGLIKMQISRLVSCTSSCNRSRIKTSKTSKMRLMLLRLRFLLTTSPSLGSDCTLVNI